MKRFWKIAVSVIIILITLYLLFFCIEMVMSEGLTDDERQSAFMWCLGISGFGIVSIVTIWSPWKKWLSNKTL